MGKNDFIKNVEKMVDPIEVGTVHFMQSYANSIPISLQYKMIAKGAKKNPYMGFVVEPYSFFLGYELEDLDWAQKLIPDNFKLVKSKIFADEEPKYYCMFGAFNVHSSAFWGTRMEFYIIAENKDTGLLSWIIVDYHTNTIGVDKKNGLKAGNTKECILTTNYNGEIVLDIRGLEDKHQLILEGSLKNGNNNQLDSRLWVEGNLSVGYGREISQNSHETFSTMFNVQEVEKALDIPIADIDINLNNWYPGLFKEKPAKIACFPYAQHYLSDSPGHFSEIKNQEELIEKVAEFDFTKIAKYSSEPLKRAFKIGQIVSITIIVILTILLIIK